MSWKNAMERRKFLSGLGMCSTLPFLETVLGRKVAHAQAANKLKRLIIVSQSHMALGYHRIPEFAKGAYGGADPSLLKVDMANGVRIGAFGSTPGKLGGFYEQGALKSNPRLQKEMMVVNGLAMNYSGAQGHISDGNGSWSAGGQSGKFNTRTRFALSGSLSGPSVTIDNIIAKKIHTSGQRSMFMGSSNWGGGGADTDESIDANGAIQALSGNTSNIYNGPIFDAGKKVTAAMQKIGAGGMTTPAVPSDPLAAMSTSDFASLMGLRFSQQERKRLLGQKSLSANDKRSLEQYYDLLNESLATAEKGATSGSGGSAGGIAGATVSPECKPLASQGGDLASFNKLMGVAFLCDLSRIGYLSVGSYQDHNTVWHAGADGDSSKVGTFNTLAVQVAQVAEFLTTLIDPATGRDMLENSIVIGITNCAAALNTDGRDTSHSYHDFTYFSVGGSAALKNGNMYDFMGYNNGKRPAVNGPIPSVNQYLQTIAAGFGLTAADWSPAGGKGFGPWMSSVCAGRPVRSDDAAKTGPIPGLLKA
ncbi:MAG: hypothetical protein SF187_09665 [Deltaproteobacteria bacterium]|nr:hypothetical protein [Deltaproteobacteria bacterium]